ncbi:transport and Golgi organization protein 6 homolog [Pseudomyrmex gracilis]|uniref:transport and Golgi organization protein 6 homolog n=1 Tax=Pseudomyrmex gracilis TaxID=219809 RepID=UPI0009951A81|nr:transport and Golgi organization protein 6 homolog [Pseudomyrmex gracilis]
MSNEVEESIENFHIRDQYLQKITDVIQSIKEKSTELGSEAVFSVKQFHSIKVGIELIASIGIIPCLLPGVGIGMAKLCPKAVEISQEDNSGCLEKYERLCFSTNALLDFFHNVNLQPAVLSQIGPLMAALLQLSHAPLTKPSNEIEPSNIDKQGFRMTIEEYQRFQNRQKEFHTKFISLINICPQYVCFRELMIILGIQNTPKWLRRETQNYLIQMLVQSNGVLSLIAAICKDGLDFGVDWKKLDIISKLIAAPHGSNADEYYKAVCPQIISLLSSNKIKHGSTISNSCIKALFDYNPNICQKRIIDVICAPLIANQSCGMKSEKEVEQCIDSLAKCFLTEDSNRLHCKVILHIATPLFCLYNKVRESACILKTNLRRLLLKLLEDETTRETLYSAFLGHNTSGEFGNYVTSQFGSSGGLEITGTEENLEYEELADTVFDLVSIAKNLSPSLFCYMLKFLSNVNKLSSDTGQNVLETEDDKIKNITMQLTACKLLSQLASTSTVQDAQVADPKPLLSFIKSLFDTWTKNCSNKTEENECELLYISLMLIKMILVERRATLKIDHFKDFSTFLKDHRKNSNMPTQLKSLIDEVTACIVTHGSTNEEPRVNFGKKHYEDLSISPSTSNKFDEAMKDLADPMLPVRAHGLITLTKLIETKDPCACARKAIVLRLFQENLKDEDSFVYLASINGLCALATAFPKEIIETLMHEYVNMPNRVAGAEITVETRIKIGEILVKTTRALGEMSVVHKNELVNGFLCAIRDADPLVRASSLSCLGELCKILNFRLGNILVEILYVIACVVRHDKAPECRRAAVLVATLLFRGLGRDTLSTLSSDLCDLYRGLKHLRNNDDDPVLRLHAQLALDEIDHIVRDHLLAPPKLEKRITLNFVT